MKGGEFDCIVVGAGHAGIEAAHAAARIGARTGLITLRRDTIAKMSCNPAIGGLGKGQIACEVDALGGLMALATDATGIQFRLLNRSKGPAVRAPRAQADKYRYQDFMRAALEETPNLTLVEAMVSDVLAERDRVRGVRCRSGAVFSAPTVVLTTGTFLRGLMHIGTERQPGGRLGEPAADELSASLERLGLEVRRLKTGTPVRLDAATCDLDRLEIQQGDDEPVPFSFMTDRIDRAQTPCWVTYTNERVHQLIRDNLDRAPLYTGPDPVDRTALLPQHRDQDSPLRRQAPPSGISRTGGRGTHDDLLQRDQHFVAPKDVQEQMLRLMPGTENVPGSSTTPTPSNTTTALRRSCSPVWRPNASPACSWPGRSTGPAATRRPPAQGILAGINAREEASAAKSRSSWDAIGRTSAS
jgi:tRNA uridine 5-carboxymethylaminomethyl modification enzyme